MSIKLPRYEAIMSKEDNCFEVPMNKKKSRPFKRHQSYSVQLTIRVK